MGEALPPVAFFFPICVRLRVGGCQGRQRQRIIESSSIKGRALHFFRAALFMSNPTPFFSYIDVVPIE